MTWNPGFSVPYPDEAEEEGEGGGGGGEGESAPTNARYLVTQADSGLSNEVVVGAAPQGEVGGAWSAITVDATHSGSSHAAVQAAAEAAAAADATTKANAAASGAASALASHEADTTSVHGIADTSALETTTGSQTKVDTHVNDTAAAHAASAISFSPVGTVAGDDLQEAIAEVATDAATALATHEADTTSVHGITNTAVLETVTGAQTKVDAKVSDTAYASSWNAVTTIAGSKNATYDEMEARRKVVAVRAGVTVANNAGTDVTLLASTITPAANAFAAPDLIMFQAHGTLFNDTGVTRTARFELKAGANVLFDWGIPNIVDMGTGEVRVWTLNGEWRCTSSGGGSYREGAAIYRLGPVAGGTSQTFEYETLSGTFAENFGSPAAIDLVVTLSAADNNLSVTCHHLVLEQMHNV